MNISKGWSRLVCLTGVVLAIGMLASTNCAFADDFEVKTSGGTVVNR